MLRIAVSARHGSCSLYIDLELGYTEEKMSNLIIPTTSPAKPTGAATPAATAPALASETEGDVGAFSFGRLLSHRISTFDLENPSDFKEKKEDASASSAPSDALVTAFLALQAGTVSAGSQALAGIGTADAADGQALAASGAPIRAAGLLGDPEKISAEPAKDSGFAAFVSSVDEELQLRPTDERHSRHSSVVGDAAMVGNAAPANFPKAVEHASAPKQPDDLSLPRVGQSGWDEPVGHKILWMADHRVQTAEVAVNPPHLGPVEIRLTLEHERASLVFVSPHGEVREALQAAMPRLDELLAGNGLMLGSVSINSGGFRQKNDSEARPNQSGRTAGRGEVRIPSAVHLDDDLSIASGSGAVDLYA